MKLNNCTNPTQDGEDTRNVEWLVYNSTAKSYTNESTIFSNGSEIIYTCSDRTYLIKGSSKAVCQNGIWTNKPPICGPKVSKGLFIDVTIDTEQVQWIGIGIGSLLVFIALLCVFNTILRCRKKKLPYRYQILQDNLVSQANSKSTQTEFNVGRLTEDFYEEIRGYEEIETYASNGDLSIDSSKSINYNYEEIKDQVKNDRLDQTDDFKKSDKCSIANEVELVAVRKSVQSQHEYAIVNKQKIPEAE